MPRHHCSPAYYPFIARLSLEEQAFVATYNMFAPQWRERVPLEGMAKAIVLDMRAMAYLERMMYGSGYERRLTIMRHVMRKHK